MSVNVVVHIIFTSVHFFDDKLFINCHFCLGFHMLINHMICQNCVYSSNELLNLLLCHSIAGSCCIVLFVCRITPSKSSSIKRLKAFFGDKVCCKLISVVSLMRWWCNM